MSTNIELLIYWFVRTHFEADYYDQEYPKDLKRLIQQFAELFFPSIIVPRQMDIPFYQLLASKLDNNMETRTLKLLYRASEHKFLA